MPTRPSSRPGRRRPPPRGRHKELAGWIFGSLLLLFLGYVFLFGPDTLPEWKRPILALLGASLFGFFTYFLTGSIKVPNAELTMSFARVGLRAAGGIAGAFLMFLLLLWSGSGPPSVQPSIQDTVDNLQPDSPAAGIPPQADSAPPESPRREPVRATPEPTSSEQVSRPSAASPADATIIEARKRLRLGLWSEAYQNFRKAYDQLPSEARAQLDTTAAAAAFGREDYRRAAQLYDSAFRAVHPP